MKLSRILLVILASSSVNLFGAFETFVDFDARTRAIANANAALPVSGSVILVNPALIPSIPRKLVSLSVMPRGLGLDLGQSFIMNLSGSLILPVKKGKIIKTESGFGIAVNALLVNNENQAAYDEFQLSVGYGIKIVKKLALGATLSGQYFVVTPANLAETPPYFNPPLTPNLNVGLHFSPFDTVSIALVGMNLVRMNFVAQGIYTTNIDYVPRSIVFGLAYSIQRFVIAMDTHFVVDTSKVNLKFGGETFFAGRRFHSGIGLEMIGPLDGQNVSIGFGGVVGPVVIDYALSYPLRLGGLGNHIFSVTFAF